MARMMALNGIKVIEMAGLAPSPFCGRILADFGADVIRVDRPGAPDVDKLGRGKKSIVVNLKKPKGIKIIEKLTRNADVFIEPYRPGVMEKLGLSPRELMQDNPGLIYARLTGFGQSGSLSQMAGHDINYVSISGILSMLGRKDAPPTPPINLLADFAGGGLMCAMGIAMALIERNSSSHGQVIDASMVEGTAYVSSFLFSTKDSFIWNNPGKRGENWLDSGTHFYDTYETSDGKFMSVGAIEPQFYKIFIHLLGVDMEEAPQLGDFTALKELISAKFKLKSQKEWCKIFDKSDACVTPVLTIEEAVNHPHNIERKTFVNTEDGWEPAPAPRLSRTPGWRDPSHTLPMIGQHTSEILASLGYSSETIQELIRSNTVTQDISSKL